MLFVILFFLGLCARVGWWPEKGSMLLLGRMVNLLKIRWRWGRGRGTATGAPYGPRDPVVAGVGDEGLGGFAKVTTPVSGVIVIFGSFSTPFVAITEIFSGSFIDADRLIAVIVVSVLISATFFFCFLLRIFFLVLVSFQFFFSSSFSGSYSIVVFVFRNHFAFQLYDFVVFSLFFSLQVLSSILDSLAGSSLDSLAVQLELSDLLPVS